MKRTVLYERHVSSNARIVEFAGWEMPIHYPTGIVEEHLATRKHAGLFDVSHMGRLLISGKNAVPFLQYVLSNNCAGLQCGEAQYTMIPNEQGGAIDDAYLYRFAEGEYLLVVNASNCEKDLSHFARALTRFENVECSNVTEHMAMLSLQGPRSKYMLSSIVEAGELPEPLRNCLSEIQIDGKRICVARTGYTGEPLGFELFVESTEATMLWERLVECGAVPAGLGARDTLRMEAGLPLYGHELGIDSGGEEIAIYSCPLARFAVSFSPLKNGFYGESQLKRQFAAYQKIVRQDYSALADLPRIVRLVAILGKGIARTGGRVFFGQKQVGWVTSGTMAPYWKTEGSGLDSVITNQRGMRAICMALIDSDVEEQQRISVEIRGKHVPALIVPYHLRSEAPPYARSIVFEAQEDAEMVSSPRQDIDYGIEKAPMLVQAAIDNTQWRQQQCINLIPSEQTQSSLTRLLSIMDPTFRYAEHKAVKAFHDAEIFYYQGTDFIAEVEQKLDDELSKFLNCAEVETRVVSGQMANMAVFSAVVDFLNRGNRKQEPRRIRSVFNNHILKGGHLSSQPMGALRDFVARDPQTDKPAVIRFPVQRDNPYRIDVSQLSDLFEQHKPELVILGKSMIIHREPVADIRRIIDELNLPTLIMYDMAHVLGLVGPYFQQPFLEGADVITGSTHKTFFGTQRGIIAADIEEYDAYYDLWDAITRRTFPGSVSNHHLGTLLGLLMAAYEMNHFKTEYQSQVLSNARAFAMALDDVGMSVAGERALSFTETHQVIVDVGFGKGIETARNLEANNIIVNFQAMPHEEGFTASGGLRLGVAEMTRFGMREKDFAAIAALIHDVVCHGRSVKDEVIALRKKFQELKFCFRTSDLEERIERLHKLV